MISKYERMKVEEFTYSQAAAYLYKLKKQGRLEERESFKQKRKEIAEAIKQERRKIALARIEKELEEKRKQEEREKAEFQKAFLEQPIDWNEQTQSFPRTSWEE